MSLVFDGIIIIVCALIVIVETRRGFIKSVMNFGSYIASLFVAYAFTPALAAYLNGKFFLSRISAGIAETLKSLTDNRNGGYDLDKLISDMPDPFVQIMDRYNVSADSIKSSVNGVFGAAEEAVDKLADNIASGVSSVISSVVAFILLLVVSLIVLRIVTALLDAIFKLPVLSTANTLLGFVFGVVCALVFAWVFSLLGVHLINAMSSVSPDMFNQEVIDSSILLKFFAKNNLLDVITGVIG